MLAEFRQSVGRVQTERRQSVDVACALSGCSANRMYTECEQSVYRVGIQCRQCVYIV